MTGPTSYEESAQTCMRRFLPQLNRGSPRPSQTGRAAMPASPRAAVPTGPSSRKASPIFRSTSIRSRPGKQFGALYSSRLPFPSGISMGPAGLEASIAGKSDGVTLVAPKRFSRRFNKPDDQARACRIHRCITDGVPPLIIPHFNHGPLPASRTSFGARAAAGRRSSPPPPHWPAHRPPPRPPSCSTYTPPFIVSLPLPPC